MWRSEIGWIVLGLDRACKTMVSVVSGNLKVMPKSIHWRKCIIIRNSGKSGSYLNPAFPAMRLVLTVKRDDEIECIGYNYDGWKRFVKLRANLG